MEKAGAGQPAGLGEKRQRYGFFTNEDRRHLDDLMIANRGDHMFVVVNAACKEGDIAHMRAGLPNIARWMRSRPRAAGAAGAGLRGGARSHRAGRAPIMKFMDVGIFTSDFDELWISRSGYTGEDGYEISVQ